MRVSINPETSLVTIDNISRVVDLSTLYSSIKNIEFWDNKGHEEYNPINGWVPPPTLFSGIDRIQEYINLWHLQDPPALTSEEQVLAEKHSRILEIKLLLSNIDLSRARPLTDIALGNGNIPDSTGITPVERLQSIENEAIQLRAELASLM